MNALDEIVSQIHWAHNHAVGIAFIATAYLWMVHQLPKHLRILGVAPWTSNVFRNVWAFWNQALAVQSGLTFFIALQISKSPNFSWHTLICDPKGHLLVQATETQIVKYVFVPFVISKIVELGDTVFLLLAQKPILFLHWFHHVTVLMFCWLNLMQPNTSGMLFVIMNSLVHTIMYTYYGLMIQKVRMQSWIAKSVTTLQISQMFVGTFATLQAVFAKLSTGFCQVPTIVTGAGCIMQSIYAFLFLQFAMNRYKTE